MFNDFRNRVITPSLAVTFCVQATFYPTLNSPVECKVDFNEEAEIQPENLEIGYVEIGTTIEALYADVGTPKQGEKFVIADRTFRVARVDSNDKVYVKVIVNEVTL